LDNILSKQSVIGIYKLVFPDGSYYIGQSVDINSRYKSHIHELTLCKHYNYKVQSCFDKQGVPKLHIMQESSLSSLNELEAQYINLKDPACLNILCGGNFQHRGENSARAVYSKETLLKVFFALTEPEVLASKEISEMFNVDLGTVSDIRAGRGRALEFKEEYPEKFNMLLKNKSHNTRGKSTITLIHSDSTAVTLTTGEYSSFCRQYGIHTSNLSKVLKGTRKSTGGWILGSKHENT